MIKTNPTELIFHVEAEIYESPGPSTVKKVQAPGTLMYYLDLFINHKNKHTAHRWTVLASFFLWLHKIGLNHKTIKPGCLSVQSACHLSAYSRLKCRKGSAKCLIQNGKDWTPNCVDRSFFIASVSSVLAMSQRSPRYRIRCQWHSCSPCIVARLQIPH